MRSYSLDAIETGTEAPRAPSKSDEVGQFLADIANAHFYAFPAISEGEDLRRNRTRRAAGLCRHEGA